MRWCFGRVTADCDNGDERVGGVVNGDSGGGGSEGDHVGFNFKRF